MAWGLTSKYSNSVGFTWNLAFFFFLYVSFFVTLVVILISSEGREALEEVIVLHT